MIKTVIFDLDGTLINSLEDLADATNHALAQEGFETHPLEKYRYFVGNGADKLVERALGKHNTPENFATVKAGFNAYYDAHCFDKTHAYEGIPELLEWLKEQGIQTAVLSNKPHEFVVQIVERLFAEHEFSVVLGNRAEFPTKPDPAQANYAISQMQANKSNCLFVGDSGVDMLTAENLGVVGVGVTWGFREEQELLENGAHYIAHTAEELKKIIQTA